LVALVVVGLTLVRLSALGPLAVKATLVVPVTVALVQVAVAVVLVRLVWQVPLLAVKVATAWPLLLPEVQ
jgi:hypothetical protein